MLLTPPNPAPSKKFEQACVLMLIVAGTNTNSVQTKTAGLHFNFKVQFFLLSLYKVWSAALWFRGLRLHANRYMPLKMNSQLNYSLDDIAQIYLTSLDNLTYELIQAERSFGFGNKTFTNPTSEQIDLAITSRKQISESAIKRLLNLLNSDSNLPKLKLMCDGKVANGNGFGFKDFAIIVDQSYIWLLRRKA